MTNPARRAVLVELDGNIHDVDENADDLETLGIYEDSLERALDRSVLVPVTELMRQEGLRYA